MVTVSRDKLKKKGIRRFFNSFGYAYEGIRYAFKYEQNITVHFIAMVLAIIFGFVFEISIIEWLIIFLIIGLVVATELINTSIEATIDLITDQTHPLAKVAKDTAAGAVLIFGITALIVAALIFIPKMLDLFMVVLL